MNKIPVPVIVGIVIVAVIILFFGIRSSGVLGGETVPSGPPKAAMEDMNRQHRQR